MKLSRRLLYPLGAGVILGYFLFFTWKSLFLYFDADDLYNLYFAWMKPAGQLLRSSLVFWSGAQRPVGAIFYRTIFAVAGFHPLPFRVAALALCAGNMALCFWFIRLLSQSERIAALATLVFAFHTRMVEVWFRTAVIYDVLCFTFVYLAACLYIEARRTGREIGGARMAAILICWLCALGSKEMAVFLPVLLLAYELTLNWRERRSMVQSRGVAVIAVMLATIVPYAAGKLAGPDAMAGNPDYRPEFSFARFSGTWSTYLGHLFVTDRPLPAWIAMATLISLLLLALAVRSRRLVFAWVLIFFGLLPVSFVPARGAFVMYISWPGWALYAATVLVAVQDLMTRQHPGYRTALACMVFVLAGWRMGKTNLHDQRIDPRPWLYRPPEMVRTMTAQILAKHPSLPHGTRILMTADPFSTDEYTPNFLLQLLYRDPAMTLDRVTMMKKIPSDWNEYQYVFDYKDKQYRQLKP